MTWDQVEEIAFSRLGWQPSEFYFSTFRSFLNAFIGYKKRTEFELTQDLERTRWQTWILASLQVQRKDLQKLRLALQLPHDKANIKNEEVAGPVTQSELEDMKRQGEKLQKILFGDGTK